MLLTKGENIEWNWKHLVLISYYNYNTTISVNTHEWTYEFEQMDK